MGDLKNLSVEGTVILVTGGTSGIGKAVTSTLCAQGASVVFTGRNETAGETILTDLRNAGHDCHFVPADLRDQEGITKVIDTCLSTFGRLMLPSITQVSLIAPHFSTSTRMKTGN